LWDSGHYGSDGLDYHTHKQMKIKITVPSYHHLIVDATQGAGELLKEISRAQLITSEGYGAELVWKAADADNRVSMEIVPDDFSAKPHDAIAKLTKENADTSKRWIDSYQETQKLTKELKELKEKIASLGIELK
jgi:hypothetical protein